MLAQEFLLSAVAAFAADQLSKSLALRAGAGEREPPEPTWLLRIRIVRNEAGCFGMVRDRDKALLLWGLAVFGLLVVIRAGRFFEPVAARVGLGAAIGGATGNLVDRLWRGAIIDFIDLRWWPVFNVADLAIVSGLTLALCFIH